VRDALWEAVRMVGKLTFEEAIASIFQRIAPVVAIGKPQRGLEVVGAARSYPAPELLEMLMALLNWAG
jgi:hypothetical protein